MKKPRLLALTTSYPLRPGGCAGVFIEHLYRGLCTAFSIEVICPGDSQSIRAFTADPRGADICVRAVGYAPRHWRVLAQQSGGIVPSLRRVPWRVLLLPVLLIALSWRCLRRAGDADAIHANWAVCGAIAGVIGCLRGKPVVTTLRGDDVTRADRSWIDRAILALAVRNSRIVICVSKAMAEQLRARFPRRAADVHVCLNGVDEAFFRIDRERQDENVLRVLAVGSLIRRKGFDVLIEAVARARHGARMMVRIIGAGPERESLLSLADHHGVSRSFDFAGELPVTEMPEIFAAADLFVLPSRSEGRPNVVVEALASGLPVISTDLEGIRGMVEHDDNGWLVPVDDADALADALDQASTNFIERCRRAARARASARASIGTWADTARCYEASFRVALGLDGKARASCAE